MHFLSQPLERWLPPVLQGGFQEGFAAENKEQDSRLRTF
jgi:hypothetical protein